MYRYTFTSKVALAATLMLCISLLFQPIASAYAQEVAAELPPVETSLDVDFDNETEVSDEEVDTESVVVDIEEVETVNPDLQEVVSDDNENESEGAQEEEDILNTTTDTGPASESEAATTATSSESETETEESEDDVQDVPEETVATSTATSTTEQESENSGESSSGGGSASDEDTADSEGSESEPANDGVVSTSTDEVLDPDSDNNQTASTTDEEMEPTVQEVSVVNSDQAIAFNRNECTEVSDGSFYCQKTDGETVADDALFAAPDSTGDMEIYVVQDGVETKLTANEMEDASPYFDSRSNTMVWHRLINDRYQIISYDVDSGEEEQLTDTRVNNMEPARSGDYTVWQRWVTNNWEIILFDGESETQLTDSQKHDIAPHIHGDMIIWNVRSSDGTQSLMTYEISTQTYNQISDADGVSVANPRMLVMYEAQYQNGDSVMKGFDLVTGEIIPIEHLPRELPGELPEPDATGETRALPTNPQNEDDLDPEEPEPDTDDPLLPDLNVSTTTVSTTTIEVSPDLDLRPADKPVATTTDLVVEQAAIPDVVIPAFEATSTDSTATSTQDI